MVYTYSRWDGSQSGYEFDADELMEALSDDLMSDGDLWNALQRLTRWGMQREDGERAPGVQNLLQQLRSQRQQELERYNLDSLIQEIKNQVSDIVQTERDGISRRLDAARQEDTEESLAEMLESIAHRKEELLAQLPDDPGSAVSALADYEFLDDQAREKFSALMDVVQQQVLQSHFQTMRESLDQAMGSERAALKEMLRDLNSLLESNIQGDEPDVRGFMEAHGRHFPGVDSFEDLVDQIREQMAQTETLLNSMSPQMRQTLEDLMQAVLRDDELRDELARMAEALQAMGPAWEPRGGYPFSGEESLTFGEALRLMRRMHDLDDLEREMRRSQDTGDLQPVDGDLVRELMGNEASQAIEHLKQLTRGLEDAGYIERRDGAYELTARGIRRIGQKALQDIFQHLKHDAFGHHPIPSGGRGDDRTEDSKPYEFGDAFLLDMQRTLMNSVHREGAGSPLKLSVDDFEVYQTEYLTQSATVLMLDMSRSMPLRGCFVAAKKVALALNSLIRTQFPRDDLYVLGFSDYARELRPESLHQITWGDYVYGTNMQHGFAVARRLLAKHKTGNKQIILITDGEPTAHFEGDRVHFSYPPTFRTFQETLREVQRCTQEGIVINTFMLERSHYLADFVNQMTRINRGRAFFATPERLGDYILVDYVASKQKSIS